MVEEPPSSKLIIDQIMITLDSFERQQSRIFKLMLFPLYGLLCLTVLFSIIVFFADPESILTVLSTGGSSLVILLIIIFILSKLHTCSSLLFIARLSLIKKDIDQFMTTIGNIVCLGDMKAILDLIPGLVSAQGGIVHGH